MKLNLGCGNAKISEWINVDKVPYCNPDQVVDLEKFPWPWPDNSVDEILLSHVLEHLGATSDVYLGIIKEIYRVCRNGAVISIVVPHPRHDHFLGDPTHVRVVIPDGLALFSQKQNREWIAKGAANTPLGIYLGVDFDITDAKLILDDIWQRKFERKQVTMDALNEAAAAYNNVIKEIQIKMTAIKPSL